MPVYFATEDGVAKRDCSPNLHTAVKLLSSFQSATSITIQFFAISGHIFSVFVNVGYEFWMSMLDTDSFLSMLDTDIITFFSSMESLLSS